MTATTLENRTLLAVTGEDAEDFLQGIITTDVPSIGAGESFAGALLTPQGKIMFEFMIGRIADGFLIETDAASGDALAKRLTLYKLRAKVTVEKRPETTVGITWDSAAPDGSLRDMRLAKAGVDVYRSAGGGGDAANAVYADLRIAHGISGGAEDGSAADYFPHDLLMDRNGGLNFKKGCYVGQEVVSRMQHRSTARRRLVSVSADAPLPEIGTSITIDGREIGALRLVGAAGDLAVVRIDKASEAMTEGKAILAGDVPVTLTLPAWSGVEFPAASDEAAS